MRNRFRAALITVAAFGPLAVAFPASAETTTIAVVSHATASQCAPADEYFGPLKLSILGVRNNLADTEARIDRGSVDSENTLKHLQLVEASLRDWEQKYPRDSWLPAMVLHLHHAYRKLATEDASLKSIDAAAWLLRKYGSSHEAQALRNELAEATQNPVSTATPADEAVGEPTVADK